jgi:hypothetical protein
LRLPAISIHKHLHIVCVGNLSFLTDRVAGQDMVSGGWSAQVKTHPVTSEGKKKKRQHQGNFQTPAVRRESRQTSNILTPHLHHHSRTIFFPPPRSFCGTWPMGIFSRVHDFSISGCGAVRRNNLHACQDSPSKIGLLICYLLRLDSLRPLLSAVGRHPRTLSRLSSQWFACLFYLIYLAPGFLLLQAK